MYNLFLEHYKWCVKNRIILPANGDEFETMVDLIIKRYTRKIYLTTHYFCDHSIYREVKIQMLKEEKRIQYWSTIVTQIIRNTKLCYDMTSVILHFLI